MPDRTIELVAAKMEVLHEDVNDMKVVLKELTSAITKLAVVEERQAQTSQAVERAFKTLEKIESRLGVLEQQSQLTGRTNVWVERGVIGLATAVVLYAGHKVGIIH